MIADKWKLNEVITDCIGSHHRGERYLKGEYGQQVALVALGNIYINILDNGICRRPVSPGRRYRSSPGIRQVYLEGYGGIGRTG